SLTQHVAQRDADILHGVVGVDVEVALRLDREVEAAVLTNLANHVVEEREAGGDGHHARPVEVEVDVDRRLLGVPRHRGATTGAHDNTSSSAFRNASFSSGVPTVTRRHPASPGHDAQL